MGLGLRAALTRFAAKIKVLTTLPRRPDVSRVNTPERLGIIYTRSDTFIDSRAIVPLLDRSRHDPAARSRDRHGPWRIGCNYRGSNGG